MKAVAAQTIDASRNPSATSSRTGRLVRAGVLFVAGLVVTFSATLHEQLAFDRTVAAATLFALAAAYVISWARATERHAVSLLFAGAALIAGVSAIVTDETASFAIVVAAWALVSGLLEFVSSTLGMSHRGDSVFMGAIGVVLALLVLLVRDDPVAIIGFFGAYAVIGGVFLAISAFDNQAPGTSDAAAGRSPSDLKAQ